MTKCHPSSPHPTRSPLPTKKKKIPGHYQTPLSPLLCQQLIWYLGKMQVWQLDGGKMDELQSCVWISLVSTSMIFLSPFTFQLFFFFSWRVQDLGSDQEKWMKNKPCSTQNSEKFGNPRGPFYRISVPPHWKATEEVWCFSVGGGYAWGAILFT